MFDSQLLHQQASLRHIQGPVVFQVHKNYTIKIIEEEIAIGGKNDSVFQKTIPSDVSRIEHRFLKDTDHHRFQTELQYPYRTHQ